MNDLTTCNVCEQDFRVSEQQTTYFDGNRLVIGYKCHGCDQTWTALYEGVVRNPTGEDLE